MTVIVIVDFSDTFLKSSNDRVESAHPVLVPSAPFVTLVERENSIVTGLSEGGGGGGGVEQSAFVTRRDEKGIVAKKNKNKTLTS